MISIADEEKEWKEFIYLAEDAAECLRSIFYQTDLKNNQETSTSSFEKTFLSAQPDCFLFNYKILLAEKVCFALKTPFHQILNASLC